jgi:hypothetical protein
MTVSVGTDSSQLLVNATAEVDLSAGNFTGLTNQGLGDGTERDSLVE